MRDAFRKTLSSPGSAWTGAPKEKVNEFGWYAVLAFLIAIPATGVWVRGDGHDYSRVVEIVVCLACAMAIALNGWPGKASGIADWTTGLLLALSFASVLCAPDLRMASREFTLLVGLVAVAGVVASRTKGSDLSLLLAAVSVAGASYATLVGLGLAVNLGMSGTLRPFDLLIGYNNGRFFNHVQTAMLPLLVLATLNPNRSRWIGHMASFALAFGIALLVLSEGRATAVAVIVAAAVGMLSFRATAWPYVRQLMLGCFGAALIYPVLFMALPRLVAMTVQVLHEDGLSSGAGAQSRWVLWAIAAAGIRRAPWLGIGPMHFSQTWNADAAHPHNVYLQVADEWGVPLLLLLLGMALFGLFRLHRAVQQCNDPAQRTLGAGLFMTTIGIAIDGMLSGNFVMPVSQVWIAVVLGSAIAWVRRSVPAQPNELTVGGSHVWRKPLRLLPLLAMLWLCASIVPDLKVHFLDLSSEANARDAGAPRFWSNGWF